METTATITPDHQDVEAVKRLQQAHQAMRHEIGKVIVGQDQVVDELLIAIFARGHCLLVGVPGLAKTLLVSTLARVLSLEFRRIQFTPDLMPADITGTDIIQEDPVTRAREFKFLPGPIFANMILADEINRTPPKTQAALLEAMQEHRVTTGGHTMVLDEPFFVLATQNPIEQEGTYPLPEAQLDRFMFMIHVDYPSQDEELEIMQRTTAPTDDTLHELMDAKEIVALQDIVRRVPVGDHVFNYAISLVRATRPGGETAPDFINEYVTWGAGPRAGQYLILGGKARAILDGRTYVTCADIVSVTKPVLRHRLITNFTAEAAGISSDVIIERLLEHIPKPVE